ncbi:MFS transporter [Caminibacter mediatlanticus TB-2]|uniref:MFS transporter n=3 Tax=Caminibacter mediatlanticus TaxID=291048 RepID=A0ABX5V764_9BACT|nr:MFS transporter [Caminibacter mediatlanticus]QCT94120.1 MFS transporter [Caminibacter mediatlanticus TB-2]
MIYLSLLMAIRFLGLFIVMPVLAIYAMHLTGATEFSVGIALGAYALSQVFLQIPFGKLADKYNKKIILVFGLFLLFLGSIVCAFSTNIYMLIFGRLLQGAGAIGGVILAYISDLTDENTRAKAFARMGQFIALSFALSMILGPTIGAKYGVDKLFLLTAILALISIFITLTKIPNPPKITHHMQKASLKEIITNKELLKLFFSGFMQKGLMSTFFLLIPLIFTQKFGYLKTELWKVYIPALIFGFFALPLGAILAEKKGKGKLVFILSAISITTALILFLIGYQLNNYFIAQLGVIIFFFGFNLLEPVLQSFVSKVAFASQKATALSISNTIQYLGIFLGGAVAGYFLKHSMLKTFLIIATIVGIIWIIALLSMKPIQKFKVVEYEKFDKNFIEELKLEKNVYDFYEKDGKLIVRYID